MTTLREAAQQALEALERSRHWSPLYRGSMGVINAIDALRAALAEPVQEPVASAGLGPLPEPAQPAEPEGYMPGCLWPLPATPDYYTAEQMREYALRALAEPVQEPVAWRTFDGEGGYDYRTYEDNEDYAAEWAKRNPRHVGWVEPLYTAPPQRKPLTEEEIDAEWRKAASEEGFTTAQFVRNFARAIERAHGIT